MTLRDLLKICRYKDVFNLIYISYYKGQSQDRTYAAAAGYRKVFTDLIMLPLKLNGEYEFFLQENEDNPQDVDVSLYCPEDGALYATDLVPWGDLIDSLVRKPISISDQRALAHNLYDLTCDGFSREATRDLRDSFED